MNLFLVTDDTGRERWVAAEDTIGEQLYVYVGNTGTFHRNDPLGVDYYQDQRLVYTPIDAAAAAAKIEAGVGRIDERKHGWLAERYRADPNARTVQAVLGEPVPSRPPSPTARARRVAEQSAKAKVGVWVTYKTYPPEKRQLAHQAAYDAQHGNIRALAPVGPLMARVRDTPEDHVEVQLARTRKSKSATDSTTAGGAASNRGPSSR